MTSKTQSAVRHIFVYGSLMSGHENEFREILMAKSAFVGRAVVTGTCNRSGEFPRAVYNADTQKLIEGEVYLIKDQNLLESLDAYEGCSESDEKPYEYLRVVVPVRLPNGETLSCFFYQYNEEYDS